MKKLFLIFLTLSFLNACGGGGGDGFIGAANVFINTSPRSIDTGDRTRVRIEISEVNENGIIVKVLFPSGLTYVFDSTFLEVDGTDFDIGPDVNASASGGNFLVFFLANEQFSSDNKGALEFDLEAVNRFSNGKIQVDADVDDPLIDNDVEFDLDQPEFLAESEVDIEVIG